jgi:probable rRNA maturation factor
VSRDRTSSSLELEILVSRDEPIPDDLSDESLESLVRTALEAEGQIGEWEINLLFTSDHAIQDMHREFMSLDSPTDILTFPFEADMFDPAMESSHGGDIVMSVETARYHAEKAGWEVADELRFLVLHGILHILDWNDVDDAARASMLARQTEILELWRASQT